PDDLRRRDSAMRRLRPRQGSRGAEPVNQNESLAAPGRALSVYLRHISLVAGVEILIVGEVGGPQTQDFTSRAATAPAATATTRRKQRLGLGGPARSR